MNGPAAPTDTTWEDLDRTRQALRQADPDIYGDLYADDFAERVTGLDRITRDPNVMGGLPCLRGLRFPVWSVLDWLASGRTPEQLLAEFPFLEPEDLRQALKWAAERLRDDVVVPRTHRAPRDPATPGTPVHNSPAAAVSPR